MYLRQRVTHNQNRQRDYENSETEGTSSDSGSEM